MRRRSTLLPNPSRLRQQYRRGGSFAHPHQPQRVRPPAQLRLQHPQSKPDRHAQPGPLPRRSRMHQKPAFTPRHLRALNSPDQAPLRHGDHTGSALQAARQGQGGGGCTDRATLDRGTAAALNVLLLGRAERRDCRVGRAAERSDNMWVGHDSMRHVQTVRPSGAASASADRLRECGMAVLPGRRSRLPRRDRPACRGLWK